MIKFEKTALATLENRLGGTKVKEDDRLIGKLL